MFSFLRIWPTLPQENQTGKTFLQPVLCIKILVYPKISYLLITTYFHSRDLKRDVAKKLEKLERRTQRAIAELIR